MTAQTPLISSGGRRSGQLGPVYFKTEEDRWGPQTAAPSGAPTLRSPLVRGHARGQAPVPSSAGQGSVCSQPRLHTVSAQCLQGGTSWFVFRTRAPAAVWQGPSGSAGWAARSVPSHRQAAGLLFMETQRSPPPPPPPGHSDGVSILFSLLGCGGCGTEIKNGQSLVALDKHWHLGCFKCEACGKQLDAEYISK